MGGRTRSILRWLRHRRSRRVSSSSFHLTTTTTTTGDDSAKDLHDPRREDAEGDGWEEVHEGPESDPEEYIALVSEDAGTRLPVRTEPRRMDPSKKVGMAFSSLLP